ncbi:MAG: YggT family protein [Gammaproteobacteria bacterium]|nr:YggT family protein [Gammaproteobacteria bacterium]MBU1645193.1 YggT family protein [Gammaproteobacteria bacterium]MBU1973430.1 YggT family protein [Gammaproteobacteria bacterium]
MLTRIVLFIAQVACDFLAALLLARFILQWARVSFRNPVGQFVIAVTDWAVLPLRRMVPGLFGLDLASLLLAWLAQLAFLALAYALSPLGPMGGMTWMGAAGAGGGILVSLMASALIEVARLAIYLAMMVVLVTALLSWINPHAPLAPFFSQLARPLLAPFQRMIPPLGGIDLSPLALLLLLQVLLMVLDSLRGMAFGLGM